MKTKAIRNVIQFSILTILAILVLSCETEIPPADITPPEFSFRLTGDGFNQVFDQDFDFENKVLRLRRDRTYDFIFSGSDDGGVDTIKWEISNSGYIRVDETIPAPWNHSYIHPYETIQWQGDASNPLTGSVVGGSFHASYDRGVVRFKFTVVDFGGTSGIPNEVERELKIYTGNVHHTRIANN